MTDFKSDKKSTIAGNLHTIAGGLNIEGGSPARDAAENKAKWANLVVVLDRPLIDHVIFDDLIASVRKAKFPILENGVVELNEIRFLTAWQTIIAYYMQQYPSMVIHIHQFPEFVGIVDFVKQFVINARQHFGLSTKVEVRTDNPFYSKQEYKTDFVLSLSQCAGLDAKFEPGAMILPTTFIPIKDNTVSVSKEYTVENQLVTDIGPILASASYKFAINMLRGYKSSNSEKKHTFEPIVVKDFHTGVKILQAVGIWNPTDEKQVTLID